MTRSAPTHPATGEPDSPRFTHAVVVGSGAMGTMMAIVLRANGLDVRVLGRHLEEIEAIAHRGENQRYLPGHRLPSGIAWTVEPQAAWHGATPGRTLVVNAVPTQQVRNAFSALVKEFNAGLVHAAAILNTAKGLERDTLLRPSQIVKDAWQDADPDVVVATLSGPTIANELARGLPATAVIAGDPPQACAGIASAVGTDFLRVYTHPDLLGVELAGATKNVIAIAAGALDGLQAGDNAKSALLARGLAEITRLGEAMGAQRDTFFGIAGVGDLATTCFSKQGRNRTFGEMIAAGMSMDAALQASAGVVEGVETTRSVITLAEQHGIDMPITRAVADVLFEGRSPIEAITQLMTRATKAEQVG